ncbi:MAG: M20/M25/M40 family metallo-hydrolase, partial [Chloroflexota bacterium]
EDLLALLAIAGPPAEEKDIAEFIRTQLMNLGIPATKIVYDSAQQQSEYGGEIGNLIVQIEGHRATSPLMFSTHLDTVPIAVGCQPRLDEDHHRIVNDAAGTALGGDNRAGCAVLLNLARVLMARNGDHPPITLVFFVQEEVGLVGSRGLDLNLLGEPRPTMCFNLDGRQVEQIVTAVIGSERFMIDVKGAAAHAGSSPGDGISAAVIAANAIADLAQNGWHGIITKPEGQGTANVGIMTGGQGSNVVMPDLKILAEARSHDSAFRQRIIETWQNAFRQAASNATNQQGHHGSVSFTKGPAYDAFALAADAPVVQATLKAAKQCDIEATLVSNDGGMDANWIVAHGIPTITISPGQRDIHTIDEWIDLVDFEKACQLIITIATQTI